MSTEQERHAIGNILAGLPLPVIVELGAYCGEDSAWMREACFQKHEINVMVEPDPRNCDVILAQRWGTNTVLIQAAIADYTGLTTFSEAYDLRSEGKRSGSGSIRNPRPHEKFFPEITFAGMSAHCWSLDHLMRSLAIEQVDMLWVDIQGAERDMIHGGGMTLANTRYLFIEAEQVELYEGQALRDELLSLLPQFKVIGEFDYNLLLEAK